MLAVWVLLALVLLRVAFVLAFWYLLTPYGRRCPACGEETVPIQSRGLVLPLLDVERRWCLSCGWSWYRRRNPPPTAREQIYGRARAPAAYRAGLRAEGTRRPSPPAPC